VKREFFAAGRQRPEDGDAHDANLVADSCMHIQLTTKAGCGQCPV
jgi:hypothetical protein